jgi:glycosyltransferase involved in cell wall biosynthesis
VRPRYLNSIDPYLHHNDRRCRTLATPDADLLTPPIKIAYLITSLEVGGSERQLVALNAGLPAEKYERHIICLSGFGPLEAKARETGATLHDLRYPRLRATGTIQWQNLPAAGVSVLRLIRLLRKIKPDILHTLIPVCNVIGAVAGKVARVPHIVCTKLALGVYRDHSRFLPVVEDRIDAAFTLVHCKSQGILEDVARREPIPREKLRVVYNGINVERFAQAIDRDETRKRIGVPADAFVIGMVANLIPYKGHRDVIAAIPQILSRFPDVHFVFVGRDDGIRESLLEQATALGVDKNITFTGLRDDVAQLMPSFDALLSASHQEGFSNVLLEGMACALPIVATTVGGNVEAVENGVTGFLVPPENPAELAESIMKLAADKAAAKRMGEAGLERVKALFSYEAMIQGMMNFYEEVLGK